MRLESALALKSELLATINHVRPEGQATSFQGAPPVSTGPSGGAIGIAKIRNGEYGLAFLVQHHAYSENLRSHREYVERKARGEVVTEKIGKVRPLVARRRDLVSHQQQRHRPLLLGVSVGHHRITAGTVGAFVKRRSDGALCVLSNAHVLAWNNEMRPDDDHTLQPGALDSGRHPDHTIGHLARMVPLEEEGVNSVDCAIALIQADGCTPTIMDSVPGLPMKLTGQTASEEELQQAAGLEVWKAGRTTGAQRGVISRTDIDDLSVLYEGLGVRKFRGVVAVESRGPKDHFVRPGDSGSLVVDKTGRALGLVFAGCTKGGRFGRGFGYVLPIRPILDALEVDLVVM